MNNSFIENVNYVANLDNKFGSIALIEKNNLSLRNETFTGIFTLKYYDKSDSLLHEIKHESLGFTHESFNTELSLFSYQINNDTNGAFVSTYSSETINFVINNIVDFNINVESSSDNIKLYEIRIEINSSTDGKIYDIVGEIKNSMMLLPKLAMISNEALLGAEVIGQNIDNINIITDNIDNVANVGENIESVNTVSGNIGDVNTVSGINSEISTLSAISDDITVNASISTSISNLSSVSDEVVVLSQIVPELESVSSVSNEIANISTIKDEITTVSNISSDVSNVSSISTDVANVSSISGDVTVVFDNISSVNSVSSNIDNIVSAGEISGNINIVALNIDSINTDANNIGSITIVAEDLSYSGFSNIDDMGSILDPVEVSPSGTSLIETVANNIDEVSAVGTNIDAVIVNAQNIVDIQNAEENATIATNQANIAITKASEASVSASEALISEGVAIVKASEASNSAGNALASEELAYKWSSEPEDVIVAGSFGIDAEYSAYHWAKKAELFAGGSITLDSLADVDTTGVANGDMIRYDSTSFKWVTYDFTRNDVIGLDTTAGVVVSEGQMAWNADEGTADLGLAGGSVLQIGQENTRTVRNDTASTIENGTVVMFAGTIGNSGRIKIAPYTGIKGTHNHIYGIATQTITPGSDGLITIDGKVRGIDTTGASVGEVWADEDILYAKPNDNGRLTNVEPGGGEIKIVVASVIKSHTNGTLEVRVLPIDENLSYTKEQSDTIFVPLEKDFILDLGGL